MMDNQELLEQLAEIEHEQWISWSKRLSSLEKISEHKLGNWRKMWIPYVDLPEGVKEFDREWARKIIPIIEAQREDAARTQAVFEKEIWEGALRKAVVLKEQMLKFKLAEEIKKYNLRAYEEYRNDARLIYVLLFKTQPEHDFPELFKPDKMTISDMKQAFSQEQQKEA